MQFTGTEQLDERTSFYKKIPFNTYYYFRDIFTKIAWINLKKTNQI